MPAIFKKLAGKQKTPEEIANALYTMSQPGIEKAYGADPRTQIANKLLATGTNTDPLQGGTTEGIARLLSGLAGGYIGNQQRSKYKAADDLLGAQQSAALNAVRGQQTGLGNVFANAPDTAGMTAINPNAAPPPPTPPQPMSGVQQGAPQAPALAPRPMRSTAAPAPSSAGTDDLYFKGIVPTEGGIKNGRFLTSSKGAIGPGQVMPGTAPEAARLAGLPFNDHLYRTDADYNNKLGSAYFNEQMKTFGGDTAKASAAYNAGPARVTRAIRRADKSGGDWTDYIPAETQKYVVDVHNRLKGQDGGNVGGGAGAGTAGGIPTPPQIATPDLPAAPTRPDAPKVPDAVRSMRMQIIDQLLGSTSGLSGGLQSLAMQPYLEKGLTEQNANENAYRDDVQAQNQTGYQADLNRFNTQDNALFQAPINERQAAIEQGYGLQDAQYQGQIAQSRQDSQNQFNAGESAKDRQAEVDKAIAKAQSFKPPVFAQKEYNEATNKIKASSNIMDLLGKRPESFGLKFSFKDDTFGQRIDPDGVAARSALAQLSGIILHGISGAAVTPEEFERNKTWLPNVNDTPEAIRKKLEGIIKTNSDSISTIQDTFGAGTYGISGANAGSTNYGAGGGGSSGNRIKYDEKGNPL